MPDDKSIFFINYFTMLALAMALFPGWTGIFPTFVQNSTEENIAFLFVVYATITGGWFFLRETIFSSVRFLKLLRDLWRSKDQ